jgi:ATP-dependent DNA ligase
VIGGYTLGTKTFDALIFGYYDGDRLLYAARTRNGFTPALRPAVAQEIPSAGNLPMPVCEPARGEERPLGQGLTKAKMVECRWLKPVLVGQFEFVEWTPDDHLRHSTFVGLRDDKSPRDVRRE